MADGVTLNAQKRTVMGKAVRRLRREGQIPANISGHNQTSTAIQVDAAEFAALLKQHGSTTLLTLAIAPDGVRDTALIGRVEHDPISRAVQHIDFRHVDLTEPIKAFVALHLEGEAPAVKRENGVLLHPLDVIEVEALPANLPAALTLDISGLEELNTMLYVRDIEVPRNVTILTDMNAVVVSIQPPRTVTEETISVEPTGVAPLAPETSQTENKEES
ncbi:MAG: 50S ribosomal protein L25 [Ktedonobacterales bacterium]